MREFMDHITNSFFEATRWNRDNSYSELNATTNGVFVILRYLAFLSNFKLLTCDDSAQIYSTSRSHTAYASTFPPSQLLSLPRAIS
jgi:hypothetical protein